ncbi:MAG: 1-deoxy-D-xylulose-5-phosphate synthase [bacterium]|nr:1-deoxy-D-xylulose-5-phosphate synthase [bacterium]
MTLLESINSPKDLKQLSFRELEQLCSEIRSFLIDNVSKTGGHLASNLGIVELTVAMLRVFDLPYDKIIYDVGHQSYVHKLLTGRYGRFSTLRTFNGLSGFPKRAESEYDCFDTGHSSTSISAALGMARAAKLSGEHRNIIALFGDGALTGGMMYEAINDAGHAKLPLILVLNDNAMSISKNVGGIARHLRRLRMHPAYRRSKDAIEALLTHIPLLGSPLLKLMRIIKDSVRTYIVPSNLFDALGLKYFGPVDGHNISELISAFERIKSEKTTAILHVQTIKGKGYFPAEQNPSKFHGIGKFDPETGSTSPSKPTYSSVFGEELVSLAESNDKIAAITGAMPSGTGLEAFAKKFKQRFFDVGIAEQHGVTLSAGLAAAGYIPVIPLYSTFLQRAYDQVLHDVCLQNLHVIFPIDRAGIVGADGETHQGVYDISYLSHMPNMAILSPDNFSEFRQMLRYAVEVHNGPIAIRYPRGSFEAEYPHEPFVFGKAVTVTEGSGVSIVCSGRMVGHSLKVNHLLKSYGIKCEIIALPTIRPLDAESILASARKCGRMITIEDNVRTGGIGSAIASLLMENGVNIRFKIFAFPDEPIVHGSVEELDKKYGVDAASIASEVYKWLK